MRLLAQRHLDTQEEPGIQPATLQLPVDLLYHLSYCTTIWLTSYTTLLFIVLINEDSTQNVSQSCRGS